MSNFYDVPFGSSHDHVFLGEGHDKNARKTWWVIGLAGTMMIVEIIGGALFGSLALVADGMHMSTHAGAMLIAALAYTYARKHAHDPRFVFGTGKLGDLPGFTRLAVVVGALVIANWSYGLIRDTGAILVDLNKDDSLARKVRKAVESAGDALVDLHVWRLGPGHFSAVAAVETNAWAHDTRFYHQLLRSIPGLSHVTVEVQHAGEH